MRKLLKATEIFAFLWILLFANLNLLLAQTSGESSVFVIPAGTIVEARMDNEINSKVSNSEDTFTVTTSKPIMRRGVEILPMGSVIEGRIIAVKAADVGRKDGRLEVKFETLKLSDGTIRKIDAALIEFDKDRNSNIFSVLAIVGGSAVGALAGVFTGSGKNALIGAGIGAGAGTSVAFLKKGSEMRIKANDEIKIRFNKEVILPVEDF